MNLTEESIRAGNLSIAYLAVIQDLKAKKAPREVIYLLENKRGAVDVKCRRLEARMTGRTAKMCRAHNYANRQCCCLADHLGDHVYREESND